MYMYTRISSSRDIEWNSKASGIKSISSFTILLEEKKKKKKKLGVNDKSVKVANERKKNSC